MSPELLRRVLESLNRSASLHNFLAGDLSLSADERSAHRLAHWQDLKLSGDVMDALVQLLMSTE